MPGVNDKTVCPNSTHLSEEYAERTRIPGNSGAPTMAEEKSPFLCQWARNRPALPRKIGATSPRLRTPYSALSGHTVLLKVAPVDPGLHLRQSEARVRNSGISTYLNVSIDRWAKVEESTYLATQPNPKAAWAEPTTAQTEPAQVQPERKRKQPSSTLKAGPNKTRNRPDGSQETHA